jgi:uncharacterized protein DUF664
MRTHNLRRGNLTAPYASIVDISVDDFLLFCERTIDGMRRAVDRLDDDSVNAVPDLPDANTPFQLMTHALGAAQWWTSHIVCGRPSDRIRDDDFNSAGTIADLHATADELVALLRDLAPELQAATGLANTARTQIPLDGEWTVGAALIHAYEELAQHLGHLEITVDLVLSG